ncbi:uncharacterized protein A1O9_04769 [Exophiala aquamarina CBS 119918]|uniref:Zn(2)-C6 fungal-type domain-containing protein n=1 Tax=Exophiala aquamarina CBS 119918 TaxID=1182545 RepID=A0A072PJ59_9EURO|nr:uncharacterized protein A1O9_04769 [Exophiala aquamarina CBS 119918]KEF59921.1 hypothetical protein A1O9_04769 [Exophiala aquamarina CBS 119918]
MSMNNHIRLACDRCRASKLRCPRVEGQRNEVCDRCRRAGMSCITSSARPLGRPRTRLPARTLAASTSRKQGHEACSSADLQMFPTSSNHATNTMSEDVLNGSPDLPNGPSWPGLSSRLSYDVIDSLIPANTNEILNFNEPTRGELQPPGLGTPDHTLYADLVMTPISNESLSLQPPDQSSAIIKLSQLIERIANHKTNAEAYPLCVPPDWRICAESSEEIARIPVVQALQVASELSVILEWLTSDPTSTTPATLSTAYHPSSFHVDSSYSRSNPNDRGTLPQDNGFPFSKPIMLLILSSYLQILDLYTYIFDRVCQVIQQIPDTTTFFHRSARFRVNGMGQLKAKLYVSFMIQAVADDLRSIENLMGLPQDFCISQHAISTKGIFSSPDALSLVQLVLCQNGRACEKDSATSLVAGLKEKIQLLERLFQR